MSTLVFRAVQTPPPLAKQGAHYTAPRGPPCLAAARSRRGSDSPPDCHSIPRRRFATQDPGEGKRFVAIILKFSEYRLMLQFCLGRSEYFIEKSLRKLHCECKIIIIKIFLFDQLNYSNEYYLLHK